MHLTFARVFLLQRFQGQQVVSVDKFVVENILVRHPVRRVVRLGRVFQQNARLKVGANILADQVSSRRCLGMVVTVMIKVAVAFERNVQGWENW